MELARRDDNEKKLQMAERKKRADELIQQKLAAFDKKMEEKELKFEDMKKKQEEDMKNKAAMTWYKMRIGEENAKRLEKRQAYEKAKSLRQMQERAQRADDIIEQMKQDQLDRARLSQQMQMKKYRLLEEVNSMMNNNGSTDLNAVAAKFGIDVEEVRTRAKTRKGLEFGETDRVPNC